jgi:hypothetical protein
VCFRHSNSRCDSVVSQSLAHRQCQNASDRESPSSRTDPLQRIARYRSPLAMGRQDTGRSGVPGRRAGNISRSAHEEGLPPPFAQACVKAPQQWNPVMRFSRPFACRVFNRVRKRQGLIQSEPAPFREDNGISPGIALPSDRSQELRWRHSTAGDHAA